MKRINITMPEATHKKLLKAKKKTGISVSELLRRLVDNHLDEETKK